MDEREKGAGIPWNTCPFSFLSSDSKGASHINCRQESDWCSMKRTEDLGSEDTEDLKLPTWRERNEMIGTCVFKEVAI